MNEVSKIQPGTILVCNTLQGPSYCQVAELVSKGEWGPHAVAVRLSGESKGELVSVHHIGDGDMLGVGWKLATSGDVKRMAFYCQDQQF